MDAKHENLIHYVKQIQKRDGITPQSLDSMLAHHDALTEKHLRKNPGQVERESILGRKVPSGVRSILPTLQEDPAETFQKVMQGKALSPADLVRLESIILPALRPAFDIENESYANLPTSWDSLNRQRGQMEPAIRGIGRIDLSGHPSYTFVGTGFVCSDTCILTNRHVAQIFVQGIQSSQQITFQPGVTSTLHMLEEVGSSAKLNLDIVAPVVVLDDWDIAVLRVAPLPSNVAPVALASHEPASISGGDAAVIGYPAFDPYESFADQATIFRTVFDKKRLQPGKMNGRTSVPSFGNNVNAICHDCSTLGGNSGSALISTDTAQVVGVHFAGVTHVSNYAVPVWELLSNPKIKALNFNFV